MEQDTAIPYFIQESLEKGNIPELRLILNKWLPNDLVDLIAQLSPDDRPLVFTLLNPSLAVRTFEFLPFRVQQEIINFLPPEQAASLLNELSPDDRTAFLEELPQSTVNELLRLLSPSERAVTLKLLGYPENSVGRLMTTDYLAVKMDWTVQQVLTYIREHGRDSETINVIYVVDNKGRLIDDLRIREFLLAPLENKISLLTDHKFVRLFVYDEDETAIQMFKKYNRVALPVTDKDDRLLGIVTIDDILNLTNEEYTEDIQKIGGSAALDEPYMQTPFLELMQKRAGWLSVLFFGEMLTASTMTYFEKEISQAVVLALFLPLIISSGGNSGSQASTLIIRSLALGEITVKDWWKVMKREISSGLFLGSLLGAIGFARIALWSMFTDLYGPHWILIATTVALTILSVVLWGTIAGSMFPLLLQRLGADPAASSAPFVATLVDVTGLVIYFVIAIFVLQGTLL